MGFVVLAAFVCGWFLVVRAYGSKGIRGFRPHLLGFCAGVVALFCAGAVGSLFDARAPAGATAVPVSTIPLQAQPKHDFVSTSAREIFADYDANEVAADQKYKGKEVDIVGTVQSIDKDAFDNIVVHLQTPNRFMSVSAMLDSKYETEAARMSKADIVGFVCTGAGRVVGSPVLKSCRPLPLESAGATGKKTR
jgi:hypothetical protein